MRHTCEAEEGCINASTHGRLCQNHYRSLQRKDAREHSEPHKNRRAAPVARFSLPRVDRADAALDRAERNARDWARGQQELDSGCQTCAQPWKVHFRRGGEWGGCSA